MSNQKAAERKLKSVVICGDWPKLEHHKATFIEFSVCFTQIENSVGKRYIAVMTRSIPDERSTIVRSDYESHKNQP
jgi:hypothetical protein